MQTILICYNKVWFYSPVSIGIPSANQPKESVEHNPDRNSRSNVKIEKIQISNENN